MKIAYLKKCKSTKIITLFNPKINNQSLKLRKMLNKKRTKIIRVQISLLKQNLKSKKKKR